jgi:hypothetical protein
MIKLNPPVWGKAKFTVQNGDGNSFSITVSGRDRWALTCLMKAGANGCTPIDNPGPRWSGYKFNLKELGLKIETIHEKHEGPFAGTHARYILQSTVTPHSNCEVQA